MAKSGTVNFYNGVATTSLRLESNDAVVLQRTIAGGDRQKHTFSFWFKRTQPQAETDFLWSKGDNASPSNIAKIEIVNAGTLDLQVYENDALVLRLKPNMLFRDTSAWYNLIIAIDSTQGTAADRARMYINGVDVLNLGGYSVATYMNQNVSTSIGHSVSGSPIEEIGEYSANNNEVHRFNGYLSDWHYVDGIKLAPTSFGELKNGVWIPVAYTGSHGDDGWHLKFDQVGVGTASTSTIGADASGNANHFSSTNIVASDCAMPDSPENNFATLNPLALGTDGTLSEGNLKIIYGSSATMTTTTATIGVSSGKWYWELNANHNGAEIVGITNISDYTGKHPGQASGSWGYYSDDGNKYVEGTASSYGASYTTGDIIGFALDMDAGTLVAYKNNSSQGTLASSLTGDIYPAIGDGASNGTTNNVFNFGQDSSFAGNETAQGNTDGNGIGDFYYAPPSGYLALCTSNLPEPTIGANSDTQADDHFTPYLWTGNGSNPRAFTDVGFQADWIWIKLRAGNFGDWHHLLADSSRGDGKTMLGNAVNVEATNDGNGTVSDTTTVGGFTVNAGSSSAYMVNDGNGTYVAWLWKANGGTT